MPHAASQLVVKRGHSMAKCMMRWTFRAHEGVATSTRLQLLPCLQMRQGNKFAS